MGSPERSSFRRYLELVRVFLTPTAAADSYAGFLLAGTLVAGTELALSTVGAVRLLGVLAISILVYWLGMAANDLFDRKKDVLGAPRRPLPSGKVTPRSAGTLCILLGATALALGVVLEIPYLVLALIGTVILYDAGGKNLAVVGNLLMGLCRSGNFLLGAAASLGTWAALSHGVLVLGAVILGFYIFCVTASSKLEDEEFDAHRLYLRASPLFVFPVLFVFLAPGQPVAWVNSILLLILLTDALRASNFAAAGPHHGVAIFVRKALAGIFLVDAGIVLAFLPVEAPPSRVTAVILGLYLLAALGWVWKRRWIRAGAAGS
jgi:hypothetical protein